MPYTVDAATNGCYEGTTVLINKFGLRDAEALAEVEAAVVPAKAAMWEAKPLCETFDFAHYKAIHHWLFEDLYEWAGEARTIDLSKKGTTFCPAGEINRVAQAIFSRLKAEKFLVGLEKPEFVLQLTDFYQRTNEFSQLDTDLLMIATIQASQGMDRLLRQVLEQGIEPEISG